MSDAVAACERWVAEVVVGLDLCPWAGAPLSQGRVRFVGVAPATLSELATEVVVEARMLAGEGCDWQTTLLVLEPRAPTPDFETLLDQIDACEGVLDHLGLLDTIHLVAFHPRFRYASGPADDPAHHVNRSPHPMVHLLRRADLDRVTIDGKTVADRNTAVLRAAAADGRFPFD